MIFNYWRPTENRTTLVFMGRELSQAEAPLAIGYDLDAAIWTSEFPNNNCVRGLYLRVNPQSLPILFFATAHITIVAQ